MGTLRSLRLRLVAVLTGVVACAMGVVFLYVVPSLRQNLISDRLTRLETVARSQQNAPGLTTAFSTGVRVRKALLHTGRLANAQAGAYSSRGGGGHPPPLEPAPDPAARAGGRLPGLLADRTLATGVTRHQASPPDSDHLGPSGVSSTSIPAAAIEPCEISQSTKLRAAAADGAAATQSISDMPAGADMLRPRAYMNTSP